MKGTNNGDKTEGQMDNKSRDSTLERYGVDSIEVLEDPGSCKNCSRTGPTIEATRKGPLCFYCRQEARRRGKL